MPVFPATFASSSSVPGVVVDSAGSLTEIHVNQRDCGGGFSTAKLLVRGDFLLVRYHNDTGTCLTLCHATDLSAIAPATDTIVSTRADADLGDAAARSVVVQRIE